MNPRIFAVGVVFLSIFALAALPTAAADEPLPDEVPQETTVEVMEYCVRIIQRAPFVEVYEC